MPFILLIAVTLFGLYFLLTWLARLDSKALSRALKIGLLTFIAIGVLLLVLSGRGLHGLALSVLILPFFFRWTFIRKREENQQNSHQDTPQFQNSFSHPKKKPYELPMTVNQARDVLGIKGALTREKINHGYKLMMERLHPDHGGSTYLAQQINEARDLLMSALKES